MSHSSIALSGLFVLALVVPVQAQGVFPVSIEQALGTVTIPQEPQRIVSLSDRDSDTLLALGVQPVAVRSPYGFEAGVGPWSEALVTGDPERWVGGGWDVNYEAVAAAEPDLIVYTVASGAEDEYARLSQIAPTIYLPAGAVGWQSTTDQTTMAIATALGREADGAALLAELDAYYAEQRAAHPEFSGRTANYLDIHTGGITSYSQAQGVNRTLYALGFDPVAGTLAVPEGQSSLNFPEERLDEITGDIVLVYPFGRTLDALIEQVPTLRRVAAMETGGFIVLDNLAFSTASVVSIRYAMDALIPQFAAALAP